MASESQTVYECDHTDCSEREVLPEFNAALPEGWVSFDLSQGPSISTQKRLYLVRVYCSKEHAVPNMVRLMQKLKDKKKEDA